MQHEVQTMQFFVCGHGNVGKRSDLESDEWNIWTGGWEKRDHCYKLWILSYLDVWSSLHTCGSQKIDAALTTLKPVSSFWPWWGGLWPKHCVQSKMEPLKWQALRACNLLDDRNTCSVWPCIPWISQILLLHQGFCCTVVSITLEIAYNWYKGMHYCNGINLKHAACLVSARTKEKI